MAASKKRKTAGATRRRKPFPFLLWAKRIGVVIGGVATTFIVFWAAQAATHVHWHPLPVKDVALAQPMIYQTQLDYDTVISNYIGRSLLFFDLDEMRLDLEALPWIRKVSLAKHWSGTITVSVTEYEPIANWNENEVLNAEGFPLQKPAADIQLANLKGPDTKSKVVMSHYLLFAEIFAGKGFSVKGVTMRPRGSWSLKLDNQVQIFLGEQDVLERTRRVVRLLESDRVQEANVQYIDARYQNGVAIKMKQNLSSEVEDDVAA
ncbi:MAG: cell division protein FtsQ/DivIB [Reinekea sp.]